MHAAGLAGRPCPHWGRLSETLIDTLAKRGVNPSWIRVGRDATLPGAYGFGRSEWDLTVVKDGFPLGAITLKSQGSLSLGKNFNNRVQELTSIAFDVRRQYGSQELYKFQPSLGLFFLLEEDERVNRPVRNWPYLFEAR